MHSFLFLLCDTVSYYGGTDVFSSCCCWIVSEPVNSLPILSDLPSSVTTEQGSNIELPCVATAFPLPVYRWSKNGISVTAGQTRVSQNGGNLLIIQAEPEDAGTYKCMAENSLGHHSATVQLEVTGWLGRLSTDICDVVVLQCSCEKFNTDNLQVAV